MASYVGKKGTASTGKREAAWPRLKYFWPISIFLHYTDSRGMFLVSKESPCYKLQFVAIFFFENWLRIRYSRAKTKKRKLFNPHPVCSPHPFSKNLERFCHLCLVAA